MQYYEGSAIKKVEEGKGRREGSRRKREKKGRRKRRNFRLSAAFSAKLSPETAHWKAALAGTHCIYCQGHQIASYRVKDFKTLMLHCQRKK